MRMQPALRRSGSPRSRGALDGANRERDAATRAIWLKSSPRGRTARTNGRALRVEIARLNGLLEMIYRSKRGRCTRRRETARTRLSRVLLVCPEPLGHGQPAGIGIRFLEIARVLRADGHRSPCFLRTPAPWKVVAPSNHSRRSSLTADARRGHRARPRGERVFSTRAPIPTVIDLYDPFIIENLHYYADAGEEVFQHDHATLMESLAHGDYFLCASEAQRLFYLGLLLASGALNPISFEEDPRSESLIGIAPFGVPPAAARKTARSRTRRSSSAGSTTGTTRSPRSTPSPSCAARFPGDADVHRCIRIPVTPQGKLAEAMAYAREGYAFVRFEPWVAVRTARRFFERFAWRVDVSALDRDRPLDAHPCLRLPLVRPADRHQPRARHGRDPGALRRGIVRTTDRRAHFAGDHRARVARSRAHAPDGRAAASSLNISGTARSSRSASSAARRASKDEGRLRIALHRARTPAFHPRPPQTAAPLA